MTDTKQICEAIKGFPEGEYLVGEFPGNGDDDNHVTTDQLKALVAENEALRQKLNSIAFYVKDHGGHLPPCDLCLIEGIVSGDILPIETAHGGNDE